MSSHPHIAAIVFALVFSGCGGSSDASPSGDDASSDDSGAFDARGDAPSDGPIDARDGSTTDALSDGLSDGKADVASDALDGSLPGWTLVWSDEFDGAEGAGPDATKWKHEVGGGGWGNSEREYYTDGNANAQQHGGELVITAKTEGASSLSCWYGPCQYTSARLITQGLFSQKYGRFAARMKIPKGQGVWPAFWMLGDDISSVGWPTCGEIDVMENIGKEPTVDHGTLHGPQPGVPDYGVGKSTELASKAPLGDDYHVYAVEWDASGAKLYLDDTMYGTVTPADLPSGAKWVFDHDFFLLLNLAIGGSWPGDPDSTTVFPAELRVDWVRAYVKS